MIENYFRRFGWAPPLIGSPPPPDLGMVVVIPCFNEPNLLAALNALDACESPACAVEVIVVVNSGENAPPEVLDRNQGTLRELSSWRSERFATRVLHFPALPAKHAGVGLARKIGMDEAVRRFSELNRLDGVILCFDADCTCDPNYLIEVGHHFRAQAKSPGCSIYFEHPLDSDAIELYELHLRYYVQGLRHAGFPHAYHTIGSSMAVRADAYVKQGGMNKRKAGEDFYFLQKIIPLGSFGEINGTRVIPSPRTSDRVPFGTGRAVREHLQGGKIQTYPLEAFDDLRKLFEQAGRLYQAAPEGLPPAMAAFLAQIGFPSALNVIRANTTSAETFTRRFFRWFDGFLAMKFIHFARDRYYGPADVRRAGSELLERMRCRGGDLLTSYRSIQRQA